MPSSPQVLFLGSGVDVPTTRYRILPFLPHLRERGARCDLALSYPEKYGSFDLIGWRASQWLKRAVRHWHRVRAAWRRYDAIVIEREIFDNPTWDLERRFREITPRLILDVDDAIFLRYPEKFAAIAGMCDTVVAGNPLLAEKAAEFCRDVVVIPTCVELDDYRLHDGTRVTGPPVIGWIGTPSNIPYLRQVAGPLRRLRERFPFRLRIVTDVEAARREAGWEELSALGAEWRPWTASGAAAEIAEFDVGIMPLPDEEWARYKCGFKLLQYMASGVAPVGSPVGVNRTILEDGVSGVLPVGDEAWFAALHGLLESPERRQAMGTAARARAAECYAVRGYVDRWWHTLFPTP